MKKYKAAAILMILHGGLMEIGGCVAVLPLCITGNDNLDMSQYFSFIVPYFQNHLQLMLVMGAIYGTVRIIGAAGLLKNRMWGFALSIINCVITMTLMMFMLPAGILDGIFACSALILMLTQYFGNKKITD